MKTLQILRHAAIALCLLPAAMAAGPSVTKTTNYQEPTILNGFCARWEYCYTIDNPAGCVVPVSEFCVKFHQGLGHIDVINVTCPPGWGFVVDPINDRICFQAIGLLAAVPPGLMQGGFKVRTNCNPRAVEGRQEYDVFGPGGVPPIGGGFCAFPQHALFGDVNVLIGTQALIGATADEFPDGLSVVFAGVFPSQGIPTVFGDLFLDPIFIQELAPIPLDPLGTGMIPLPIPPDPNLAGFDLPLQALVLDPQNPRQLPQLSNLLEIQLR